MLAQSKIRQGKIRAHQRGIGMIELLSSLLVLSVGILGISSLQSRSLQFNQGAIHESRAAILANDILDRMRANPTQIALYRISFSDTTPAAPNCYGTGADCSLAQLADYDLESWRDELRFALPKGNGQVEVVNSAGGRQVVVVTVQYIDDRAEKSTASGQSNGTSPKQVVVRTSI